MYQNSLPMSKPQSARITREQIQQTKSYQEQPRMLQNLLMGKTNVESIQNGVNVSLNKGFEYWDQISKARWQNKQIVEELLKTIN